MFFRAWQPLPVRHSDPSHLLRAARRTLDGKAIQTVEYTIRSRSLQERLPLQKRMFLQRLPFIHPLAAQPLEAARAAEKTPGTAVESQTARQDRSSGPFLQMQRPQLNHPFEDDSKSGVCLESSSGPESIGFQSLCGERGCACSKTCHWPPTRCRPQARDRPDPALVPSAGRGS